MRSAILSLLIALPACGNGNGHHHGDAGYDCSREERSDTYSAGMVKSGPNGYQVALLDARPAPPQRFDNDWTIEIRDPGGAATTAPTVAVEPCMPDHGHGTPIVAEVTPPGEEETAFEVETINLFMPGLWRVSVLVDPGGEEIDAVDFCLRPTGDEIEFYFCIDG